MTNLSENLKDEQIANQAAEIESQRRKIESLERELQRHLDPDSGEIRLTRRGQKHGESALLEQIATLQKELADCLDAAPAELVRDGDRLLEERIYITITSAFLPTHSWRKGRDNEEQMTLNFQAWWMFRETLFTTDLFNDHWTAPDFREGLNILNDICQATDGGPTKLKHFDKYDFANRLFGGGGDEHHERKCRAVQSLISSLVIIRQHSEDKDIKNAFSADEINDMLAALKIVSLCQKLWTDAKPEIKQAQIEAR